MPTFFAFAPSASFEDIDKTTGLFVVGGVGGGGGGGVGGGGCIFGEFCRDINLIIIYGIKIKF